MSSFGGSTRQSGDGYSALHEGLLCKSTDALQGRTTTKGTNTIEIVSFTMVVHEKNWLIALNGDHKYRPTVKNAHSPPISSRTIYSRKQKVIARYSLIWRGSQLSNAEGSLHFRTQGPNG